MTYAGETPLAALWELGRARFPISGIRSGADDGADGKTLVGIGVGCRCSRGWAGSSALLYPGQRQAGLNGRGWPLSQAPSELAWVRLRLGRPPARIQPQDVARYFPVRAMFW